MAVFTASNVAGLASAISAANSNSSASNTINLAAGTYTLGGSLGELLVEDLNSGVSAKTLNIVGAGQATTTIDGASSERVFEIASSSARRCRSSFSI